MDGMEVSLPSRYLAETKRLIRAFLFAAVETKRLKRRNLKDECDQLHAAVQLDVKEIRVPLLLLYVGPTSLDDFKSLQYECEYYSVKSVEEFEEKFFDGADSWDY